MRYLLLPGVSTFHPVAKSYAFKRRPYRQNRIGELCLLAPGINSSVLQIMVRLSWRRIASEHSQLSTAPVRRQALRGAHRRFAR